MSQLGVYLSYSPRDNVFTQRLAWALRGAGAKVWFTNRLDSSLPSQVTVREMNCDVFIVVVSDAALASKRVWAELNRALTQRNESLDAIAATFERLRAQKSEYASLYAANRTYFERHVFPVLAEPPSEGKITNDWHDLLRLFPTLSLPESSFSQDASIKQAVQAVAATVPPFEIRLDLASIESEDLTRLPEWLHPVAPPANALTQWPAPMDVASSIDELVREGAEYSGEDSLAPDAEDHDASSVWCVVANVAEEQHYGHAGSEILRGTKHFTAGAKVYCLPAQWGDGYQDIIVIGRHRKSHRYIKIVIPSRRLTNWRADLVYSPHVIAELANDWDGSPRSQLLAQDIAAACKVREAEQKRTSDSSHV